LGAFHAWRKLHDRRRPTGNWRVCSENLDRHEYAERDECRARGSFDRAEARPEPAEKRRQVLRRYRQEHQRRGDAGSSAAQ
jgi:hypothetical protein